MKIVSESSVQLVPSDQPMAICFVKLYLFEKEII